LTWIETLWKRVEVVREGQTKTNGPKKRWKFCLFIFRYRYSIDIDIDSQTVWWSDSDSPEKLNVSEKNLDSKCVYGNLESCQTHLGRMWIGCMEFACPWLTHHHATRSQEVPSMAARCMDTSSWKLYTTYNTRTKFHLERLYILSSIVLGGWPQSKFVRCFQMDTKNTRCTELSSSPMPAT